MDGKKLTTVKTSRAALVSEAMHGVLKEFADLVSGEMKILAKNGKAIPLTSPKGGFAG
jgi:hypothetical protein